MDYSDDDYAELKSLLAAFKAGEFQMTRNGVPLVEQDRERFIRHLIYLEFSHARTLELTKKA